MKQLKDIIELSGDYKYEKIGTSLILQADCFSWLNRLPSNSIHAVVTDPPYGVKEYELEQIAKRESATGGSWRIPPHLTGIKGHLSHDLQHSPRKNEQR